MVSKYQCDFCRTTVEFNTKNPKEHNMLKFCETCYERESDTGETV